MDSWAEAEWLERFRALAAGRTVVIITHRFTTAMRADIIHVMAGGEIVESGSHESLIELRGALRPLLARPDAGPRWQRRLRALTPTTRTRVPASPCRGRGEILSSPSPAERSEGIQGEGGWGVRG